MSQRADRAVIDASVDRYRKGVSAAARLGRLACEADLDSVCGAWNAHELARHLFCVAGWYHEWLDRAQSGIAEPPFGYEQLDLMAELGVKELTQIEWESAIEGYEEAATRYIDRATANWDLAYGYPRATVTTGLHFAVAAVEWHVHAWDFAEALGEHYRPQNSYGLLRDAARCVAAPQSRAHSRALGVAVSTVGRLGPWSRLLRQSGRH